MLSTDENTLIRELGDEPADMRVKLYYCYKEKYGKDLQQVMKSELGSNDLGTTLQLLSLPLDMAEAFMIKNAMKGVGTKERLLYPILCGRENDEIVKLKATYFSMFSEDMSIELAGELGGDFLRMISLCLQGLEKEYDTDYFTDEKAEADADAFHKAADGRFGTDEDSLFKIIGESPEQHLEKVNQIYDQKHGLTLIGSLNSEIGGDAGRAARYAVGMKLKPYVTAAQHIAKCCEGFGTGAYRWI
jgi:annexin A13